MIHLIWYVIVGFSIFQSRSIESVSVQYVDNLHSGSATTGQGNGDVPPVMLSSGKENLLTYKSLDASGGSGTATRLYFLVPINRSVGMQN